MYFSIVKPNQRNINKQHESKVMQLEIIKNLTQQSQERFSSEDEHHEFLMFQIQHHLVEINDLTAKKDPHCKKEIADLAVLCHMLAINKNVDSKIFKQRLVKFKSKINNSKTEEL